jgi:hypothetical protein
LVWVITFGDNNYKRSYQKGLFTQLQRLGRIIIDL